MSDSEGSSNRMLRLMRLLRLLKLLRLLRLNRLMMKYEEELQHIMTLLQVRFYLPLGPLGLYLDI